MQKMLMTDFWDMLRNNHSGKSPNSDWIIVGIGFYYSIIAIVCVSNKKARKTISVVSVAAGIPGGIFLITLRQIKHLREVAFLHGDITASLQVTQAF